MSRVVIRCQEVGGRQVAANGIGVDGTIEMAAKVKVVGQTEGEAIAKVALDGQVRLLRIGVDEVLGLRVTEGLEAQWQESPLGQIEIVLIEEDRLGNIQRLELLLVRLVKEIGIRLGKDSWCTLRRGGINEVALENRDPVQIARTACR